MLLGEQADPNERVYVKVDVWDGVCGVGAGSAGGYGVCRQVICVADGHTSVMRRRR